MRLRRLCLALAALPLAGCARLDELVVTPAVTPAQWCEQRPCLDIDGIVLTEPSSTVLVFALAIWWVAVGAYFLGTARGQRSRRWLGIALVLGGLGAGQAGISYQAFSYELKCAGRDACRLTTGFEVGYSVTQALSVSAMLTAVAYATSTGRARRGLMAYAAVNAAAYAVIAAIGSWLPSRLLLSFEVIMLFALPGIVIVIVVCARRYLRLHDPMDRSLLWAAILLVAVHIAYFGYYAAGVTSALWANGTGAWFSENDVLHVGMILWLAYVAFVVGRHLRDA